MNKLRAVFATYGEASLPLSGERVVREIRPAVATLAGFNIQFTGFDMHRRGRAVYLLKLVFFKLKETWRFGASKLILSHALSLNCLF